MQFRGDYSSRTWAALMDEHREVVARTSTEVAAGLINEITPTHVRIGNKRIIRANIVSSRKVPRTVNT